MIFSGKPGFTAKKFKKKFCSFSNQFFPNLKKKRVICRKIYRNTAKKCKFFLNIEEEEKILHCNQFHTSKCHIRETLYLSMCADRSTDSKESKEKRKLFKRCHLSCVTYGLLPVSFHMSLLPKVTATESPLLTLTVCTAQYCCWSWPRIINNKLQRPENHFFLVLQFLTRSLSHSACSLVR